MLWSPICLVTILYSQFCDEQKKKKKKVKICVPLHLTSWIYEFLNNNNIPKSEVNKVFIKILFEITIFI